MKFMRLFASVAVRLFPALAMSVVVAGCGGGVSDFAQNRDENARNPIHEWAIRNNAEAIDSLDGGDQRLNEGDENGWTPLHWAAALGNLDALIALLQKGADSNARAKGDGSLISESALRVFWEFGKEDFLEGWWNESDTVLLAAVYSNNPNIIFALVQSGADVNASSSGLVTPLHEAAGIGALQAVVALAESGANLESRDDEWAATPLHWATFPNPNAPEIIAELVQRGVDPNEPAGLKETPLHWAAENNAFVAIAVLIDFGAEPNMPDALGYTPLDWAVEEENHFAASMLRRNGGRLGEDLQ